MISLDKQYFTINEFCRLYGVGRTFAYGEIDKGRLIAQKFGRSTKIAVDEAQRWAAAQPRLKPRAQEQAPANCSPHLYDR